jgi:hypothetical protein
MMFLSYESYTDNFMVMGKIVSYELLIYCDFIGNK